MTADDSELGAALEIDSEAGRIRAALHRRLADVEPEPPRRIGRFTVLRRVGQGGMGTVWAVYDDELDRRVALKLIRGSGSAELAKRLQREAQALARLSHPNVVPVFEVGQHERQLFLVMEFVAGPTLRKWIAERPSPADILDKYVQAGRGLAAAHAAGLVHRDFKPDNAIVGDGGRVRVLDFGLVRRELETTDPDLDEALPLRSDRGDDPALTATGSTMGTPAYMAAEQFLGEAIDHRCDQFSFCVALWEALCGERPFAGSTRAELLINVTRGRMREPPRDAAMPRWLRPLLQQGLRADPDARWPSMAALLETIERGRRPRRTALVVGASTLAVGGALAVGAAMRNEPCEQAAVALDRTLDGARIDSIAASLADVALPYAPQTGARVREALERWRDAWRSARTDACEATMVRGEQSQMLMDLRMQCLERNAQDVVPLLTRLEQADATVVEHAIDLVASMPGATRCDDADALLTTTPMPADADQRREIARIREAHVALALGAELGERNTADEFDALVQRAEAVEHPPTLAAVLLDQAYAAREDRRDADSAAMAERAIAAAIAGGDEAIAFRAAAHRAAILGDTLGRRDESLSSSTLAEAWWRHRGKDPGEQLRLLSTRIVAHNGAARVTEARLDGSAAMALAMSLPRSFENERAAAGLRQNLMVTELLAGDNDAALAHGLAAAEQFAELYGPQHPRSASIATNLGAVLARLGRLDEAEVQLRRAAAILSALPGPDERALLRPLGNLGEVLRRRGDFAGAEEHLRRVLAIAERELGEGSADAATIRYNLAHVLWQRERADAALPLARRALADRQRLLGDRHPDTAVAAGLLAAIELQQGALDDALAHARSAAEALRESTDDERRGSVLVQLAAVELARGELDDARRDLDAALALARREDGDADAVYTAELRAQLETKAGDEAAAARWRERVRTAALALPAAHPVRRRIEAAATP